MTLAGTSRLLAVPDFETVSLPVRSFFLFWGEAQVLRWTDPAADREQVLVRATVTHLPKGGGTAGSLVLTNRRLVWIWGVIRFAKALVIPRSAVRSISYDPASPFPIQIMYTDQFGVLKELRLRPYSYWEGVAVGALGGTVAGAPAVAAAGHVALGAMVVASPGSRKKAARTVAALRAGFNAPPEAQGMPALVLPQDIGGFTLKSLLLVPGLAVVTILALSGLVIALVVHSGAQRAKAAYSALPGCSATQTVGCIESEQGVVLARGGGRHLDGSVPDGSLWLLIRLDNGRQAYGDFLDSSRLDSIRRGALVSVRLRDGKVMAVGVDQEHLISTAASPVYGEENSKWLVLLFLLFLVLSAPCTALTAAFVVRRSQLPWLRRHQTALPSLT